MMDKLFMAACMAILVAGISTVAHSGPSHYNAEEIARYDQLQRYKAQGWD